MATADVNVNEETITKSEVVEPGKFRVVLHNDDKTTFDFVIYVLESIFEKTREDAVKITHFVHENDAATAGIYTHQIAETKVEETTELARINNFPLKVTLEEV